MILPTVLVLYIAYSTAINSQKTSSPHPNPYLLENCEFLIAPHVFAPQAHHTTQNHIRSLVVRSSKVLFHDTHGMYNIGINIIINARPPGMKVTSSQYFGRGPCIQHPTLHHQNISKLALSSLFLAPTLHPISTSKTSLLSLFVDFD